jgi:predicted DNA-binding transcriptional regulator AlpA
MNEGVALTVLDGSEAPALPEGEADASAERPSDGPGVLIDALARLPERAILDETRLASALGVSGRTVRRMVSRYELPPPISMAGRSVWFAGRVLNHLDAAFERAENEANRNAARLRELNPA